MATYLEYMAAALKHAKFERMEDGRYFASIPDFDGLWAVGQTEAEATKELRDALDGWIDALVKIANQRPPIVDGVDLFAPPKPVAD